MRFLPFAAVAALAIGAVPARAEETYKIRLSGQGDVFVSGGSNTYAVETYKIRLSGQGDVFVSGGSNTYAVVKRQADGSYSVYHTTLKSNYWTGAGVWYDHETTASRACPPVAPGWDKPSNCIEGKGGTIRLPEGAKLNDYTLEIKYLEKGAEQYVKFRVEQAPTPKQ